MAGKPTGGTSQKNTTKTRPENPQNADRACGVCGTRSVQVKCPRCKTIQWDLVLTAVKARRERGSSVEAASLHVVQTGKDEQTNQQPLKRRCNSADSRVITNQQFGEDRQRNEQIKLQVSQAPAFFTCDRCRVEIAKKGLCDKCMISPYCSKCCTYVPAGYTNCPRCEKQCKKCGKGFDLRASFCPHCNKEEQQRMCSICGKQPAPGPSGICKICSQQKPASVPVRLQEAKIDVRPRTVELNQPQRQPKKEQQVPSTGPASIGDQGHLLKPEQPQKKPTALDSSPPTNPGISVPPQSQNLDRACGVCGTRSVQVKCPRCKTIQWDLVLTAVKARKERGISVEGASLHVVQIGKDEQINLAYYQPEKSRPHSADSRVRADQQFREDRQRGEQIKLQVSQAPAFFTCDRCRVEIGKEGLCDKCMTFFYCSKCSVHAPAGYPYCPRCEKQCKKCGKGFDLRASFCPHCNKEEQHRMCSVCRKLPAPGPSGICKVCSQSKPASLPVRLEEAKTGVRPKTVELTQPQRQPKKDIQVNGRVNRNKY